MHPHHDTPQHNSPEHGDAPESVPAQHARRTHRAGRPDRTTAARSRHRARRRRSPTALSTALATALLATGAGGYLLLHRNASPTTLATTADSPPNNRSAGPAPSSAPPTAHLTIPAGVTVPGELDLAWPASGQAAVAIPGIGLMGAHGPTTTPQPIASVTKTLTAYVILHDHPLAPGQDGPTITIQPAEVQDYYDGLKLHQSLVPLHTGQHFTERQALQALMLASADDMAMVLARWDAGSQTAFVARMNSTAAALGMTHSHFTDASGYQPTSVSTATDLIKLGGAAIREPVFTRIVAERAATIPGGTVTNYNALLGTDGIDGIKTGSTYWAGGCLLISAHYTHHGHDITLIGAVLGQPGTITSMLTHTFTASRRLIASAENSLTTLRIARAHTPIATRTDGHTTTRLAADHDITLTAWPELQLRLHLTTTRTTTTLTSTPATDPHHTTLTHDRLTPLP